MKTPQKAQLPWRSLHGLKQEASWSSFVEANPPTEFQHSFDALNIRMFECSHHNIRNSVKWKKKWNITVNHPYDHSSRCYQRHKRAWKLKLCKRRINFRSSSRWTSWQKIWDRAVLFLASSFFMILLALKATTPAIRTIKGEDCKNRALKRWQHLAILHTTRWAMHQRF